MTKIIAINRKYLMMVASAFVICLIGIAGISHWHNTEASVSKINSNPGIKMLSVTVEPASIVKDLTYGSVTLKGTQVINTKMFDLSGNRTKHDSQKDDERSCRVTSEYHW